MEMTLWAVPAPSGSGRNEIMRRENAEPVEERRAKLARK